MSDEQKPDGEQVKADAEPAKQKVWTDDEVQKIIKERDSAKKKAQAREEQDKAAQEAKMLEEGKTKELLAQREAELAEARKESEEAKAFKTAQRNALLSKLSDDDKEFVEGMSLDKLQRFVDKQTQSQSTQRSAEKWKPGNATAKPIFKTAKENADWLKSQGLAVE
jgi:hypothetical protein